MTPAVLALVSSEVRASPVIIEPADVGAMVFDADDPDAFIELPTDNWSQGYSEDKGFTPAFDGTKGTYTFEGDAMYLTPLNGAQLEHEFNDWGIPEALQLPSRKGSRGLPDFPGAKRSANVKRRITVGWCCKPGASKEDRATKIIDTYPNQYHVDGKPKY